MGWKNIFIGEKMPDKDDPLYRQRYETEVQAGRKFAKTMKLDVLAAKVQLFANDHKLLFLYLVFGFIIFCFGLNIYRQDKVLRKGKSRCCVCDTAKSGKLLKMPTPRILS